MRANRGRGASPSTRRSAGKGGLKRGSGKPASTDLRSEAWEARELTPKNWADFESFFAQYDGVQAGCWCMFYHREGPNGPLESATRQEENRADHERLLKQGHAQGILVYSKGRPVGWCQFGLREDLPRIERGRKYRAMPDLLADPPRWRITCFFVDRGHRRKGVARFALRNALAAMSRQGGGFVEAYPVTRPGAVENWFGSSDMFMSEGFRVIRPFGRSHLLVRKRLSPTGKRPPSG